MGQFNRQQDDWELSERMEWDSALRNEIFQPDADAQILECACTYCWIHRKKPSPKPMTPVQHRQVRREIAEAVLMSIGLLLFAYVMGGCL